MLILIPCRTLVKSVLPLLLFWRQTVKVQVPVCVIPYDEWVVIVVVGVFSLVPSGTALSCKLVPLIAGAGSILTFAVVARTDAMILLAIMFA